MIGRGHQYLRNCRHVQLSADSYISLGSIMACSIVSPLIRFAHMWWVRCFAVCTIATTPHTLLGSALSLLLVFRTNASYARLVEGRRVCTSSIL